MWHNFMTVLIWHNREIGIWSHCAEGAIQEVPRCRQDTRGSATYRKQIAYVYGIVDHCKEPTATKKPGEFCISLKIIDETSVDGLPCVLFGTLETLPS